MMLRIYLSSCAVLFGMALGCSTEPAKPAAAGGGGTAPRPATAGGPPMFALAPPGDATPPLDGGKVQSTMPAGWKFLPRSNDYLFAAYLEDKAGVPRIVLKQTDADGLPDSDSDAAVDQLVAKVTEEVGSDKKAAITKMNLGGNRFVRFEKAMSFRSQPASGVTLETVLGGKRYSIELLSYTSDNSRHLPSLYRFAADLKVSDGTTAPAEEPMATEEPKEEAGSEEEPMTEEKPGEEKPAEASAEESSAESPE